MADIQMAELRPGARQATLAFKVLRRATFSPERAAAARRASGPALRLYAGDHDAPTFAFIHAATQLFATLTRPNSPLRSLLRAPAGGAPLHWLLFSPQASRLEQIDAFTAAAIIRAVATQDATRDSGDPQGGVVVELVGADTEADTTPEAQLALTEALIDQVWRDVSALSPPGIAAGDVGAPAVQAAPRARTTPAEAARQRREAFLSRNWPTSITVGERLGANHPAQRAADLRAAGRILGAWSAPARTYVHPDCQFDAAGQPLEAMRALLQLLPADGDPGGWRRVFWLYGPREALGGRAPADLLASDPGAVLVLAEAEFGPQASPAEGTAE